MEKVRTQTAKGTVFVEDLKKATKEIPVKGPKETLQAIRISIEKQNDV